MARKQRTTSRICSTVNMIVATVVLLAGSLWVTSMFYFSGSAHMEDEHGLADDSNKNAMDRPALRQSASPRKTLSQEALRRAATTDYRNEALTDMATAQLPQKEIPLTPAPPPPVAPAPPPPPPVGSTVLCGGHRAPTCPECTSGHDAGWCNGECSMFAGVCQPRSVREGASMQQIISEMVKEYPFQPVKVVPPDDDVNIVLVRSPLGENHKEDVRKYKDKILFLGISSMEDFPISSPNPFSANFPNDEYTGLFPGFLHMFRHPEQIFPSHVKLLLQSQSDFNIPDVGPQPDKKYDFVFSGTDQDVANDCVGWASFAKNWTFVKQALEVMCGEFGMTGVLVASKDKQGKKTCTIPSVCKGKVIQTSFLPQWQFFDYVRQSRFALLPQVHDASPRAATHALSMDTPVLMNWHIMGGWKYVNERTGEFFHDMSDFRTSLKRLMSKLGTYEPRKYMLENYGDEIQGARLKQFVQDNFGDLVKLRKDARLLIPIGA